MIDKQRIQDILAETLLKIEAETGEMLEAVYSNWGVTPEGHVLDGIEYTTLSERMNLVIGSSIPYLRTGSVMRNQLDRKL